MLRWRALSVAITPQNTVEKPMLPVVPRMSLVGHLLWFGIALRRYGRVRRGGERVTP
jgi:hypothetical protein